MIKELEARLNLEMIKYYVSKVMWCHGTGKVLDYRNVIVVQAEKDGYTQTKLFHGSLSPKMDELMSKLTAKGMSVTITKNIK